MISLVVILCHSLTGIAEPLCVEEVVPTPLLVAGKVSDQIPMTFTMTMCSIEGQQLAMDWLASPEQQQYRGWTLVPPIKCVPGKYEPRKAA